MTAFFIFKRESEMEAEQSEGLHFRTSAETTGQQTFIFKRESEMEAEQSEGLHFRTCPLLESEPACRQAGAETTGSIPLKLLPKLSERSACSSLEEGRHNAPHSSLAGNLYCLKKYAQNVRLYLCK